jgi:hypothetical protein
MFDGAIEGWPESSYNASNSGLKEPQHRDRQLANRAQQKIHRNSLLQRNIAEHRILFDF